MGWEFVFVLNLGICVVSVFVFSDRVFYFFFIVCISLCFFYDRFMYFWLYDCVCIWGYNVFLVVFEMIFLGWDDGSVLSW